MPTYRPPDSDIKRLAFLKQAAQAGMQDHERGNFYLSAETIQALEAMAVQYQATYDTVSDRLSARSREVAEKDAAMVELERYVRDLWEVLRRRVVRHNQPAAVLQHYRLELDGSTPHPTSLKEWLELSADVVRGDAEAVAAGFPPMVNPSAAEVQGVLDVLVQQAADVSPSNRAYDEALETVEALRPGADALLEEVMDELRYALRKKEPPSQRNIMRDYGATFHALPGEKAVAGYESLAEGDPTQPEATG